MKWSRRDIGRRVWRGATTTAAVGREGRQQERGGLTSVVILAGVSEEELCKVGNGR